VQTFPTPFPPKTPPPPAISGEVLLSFWKISKGFE